MSTVPGERALGRKASRVRRLARKWRFYSSRYGALHAFCIRLALMLPSFWRLVGPLVTRPCLQKWLQDDGRRRILNLGGGSNLRPEWLTADVDPRADVFMDLTGPLPVPSASTDAILLEEVIEHLPFLVARRLLTECRRVLRPGGKMRITTPDPGWFYAIVTGRAAVKGQLLREEIAAIAGDGELPQEIQGAAALNSVFYGHGHRFIYTPESLAFLLADSGFTNVHRSCYRDPLSDLACFDSHPERFDHPPEMSLYYECRKPSATCQDQ